MRGRGSDRLTGGPWDPGMRDRVHLHRKHTGFPSLSSALPSYDLGPLITTLQASVSLTNKDMPSAPGLAKKTPIGYFILSFFLFFFTLLSLNRGGGAAH